MAIFVVGSSTLRGGDTLRAVIPDNLLVDADPQRFGVWERIPITYTGSARDVVQTIGCASARVTSDAVAVNSMTMSATVRAYTGHTVDGGVARQTYEPATKQWAAADVYAYNQQEEFLETLTLLFWPDGVRLDG